MPQKTAPVTKNKTVHSKSDPTVFLVVASFVVMVLSIILLRWVARNYVLDGMFLHIYSASRCAAWICLGLAVVSLGLLIAVRRPVVRAVCPYTLALGLLWSLTAAILRNFWVNQMMPLYLLHASVYCLYIVYLLYRAEFFCVSLATVTAGVSFYLYHIGLGPNLRCFIIGATLVLVLVLVLLTALLCGRNKGSLVLGKRTYCVFPKSFTPLLLYITCLIWFACFVLCLILGPAFAYYCIFAAVAYELIAAVYYTFQLK